MFVIIKEKRTFFYFYFFFGCDERWTNVRYRIHPVYVKQDKHNAQRRRNNNNNIVRNRVRGFWCFCSTRLDLWMVVECWTGGYPTGGCLSLDIKAAAAISSVQGRQMARQSRSLPVCKHKQTLPGQTAARLGVHYVHDSCYRVCRGGRRQQITTRRQRIRCSCLQCVVPCSSSLSS